MPASSPIGSDAPTPPRRSVCVYCGARAGRNPAYLREAEALGRGLADAGLRLVYGAGDLGLMGATARACLAAGGDAFGVIPRGLWEREVGKRDLPHVVVTESLQQRKALMLENAAAAVVLPGGLGTLDEVIEALSWRQIGLHHKPLVLVDVDGYWRPLLQLFEQMAAEDFLHSDLNSCFDVAPSGAAAVAAVRRALDA